MAADVVLTVVETDLKLLAAEAKKAEGPMTNLMGILHHSDLPAVKDATERALQKVRTVEHGGLSGVQQALEILAPFALACETKYAKLACIGISAFQKLLANDAVSIRGRCEIIKALHAAERLNDESVKLRILQASLTIIQSPSFADEQDAIQQLLSLTFRLYVNNKSNFAVHSTAAATIRQAVALIFDHAILVGRAGDGQTSAAGTASLGSSPRTSISTPLRSGYSAGGANSPGPPVTTSGDGAGPPGREVVPVLLLEEMMGWLGAREGKELGWIQLQQKNSSNRVDRTFLLETLEAVLLQRAATIHRLAGLAQCVTVKVAPAVSSLLDSACDRLVDPNDALDCRLVVRCAAALIRRHHDLAPERAAGMVVRLAETAGSVGRQGAAQRWQRFMVLQALRPLLADPSLLYRLYYMTLPTAATGRESNGGAGVTAGSGGGGGSGVLSIVVQSLNDALRWYVRTSIETPEDDVVAALGNLYLQRAMGARDSVQETEAFGANLAHGSEVVIAHLALECVLAMVASTEALTDVVVVPAEPGMPSPKLIARDTPDVKVAAVAGLVSELWRCVLGVYNTLLARAGHEVLVGLLVRGMQGITYSAGALGVRDARDALLHALCAHTLLPPGEDDAAALAAGTSAAAGPSSSSSSGAAASSEDRSIGGGSRRMVLTAAAAAAGGSTASSSSSSAVGPHPAPGFLTAILVERSLSSVRVVLTPRNIAALRAIFNLAHRLADGLGSTGWLYVVDAVNALDRILASPHTTTAAYLLETGNDGEAVLGLQPMNSTAMPITGPSAGAAGGGVGVPIGGAGAGAAAAALVTGPPGPAAAGDGSADDISTTAQRELRILSSAADQLFENTHHMSPEAVVSLLSALADISHRTLAGLGLLAGGSAAGAASGGGGGAAAAAAAAAGTAASAALALPSSGSGGVVLPVSGGVGGGGGGPMGVSSAAAAATPAGTVRLCALNRMVDTLLHNLWRVQDLWGIFLAHVLEVLASNNVQVRAAAVDALDRTITGALNPDLHVPDKFTAPLPGLEDALSPSSTAAFATAAARKALLPGLLPSGQVSPATAVGGITPKRVSGSGGAPAGTLAAAAQATSTATPSPGPSSSWRASHGGTIAAAGVPRPSSDLVSRPPPHLPGPQAAAAAAAAASSPFASSLTTATAATAPAPAPASTSSTAACTPLVANRGVQQSAQREDVQHMLLVALDSLYREGGRSPDVRRGLLRIALHVLQHHGDGLTRGWVPMLRLLDAVPRGGAGQGAADVRLGYQVVELLATDYLSFSLPKEHLAKALEVIAKFATQDTVLNVSLSSITMLWNVTDHLARSRGTFSKAAGAAQHPHVQPPQPQPQQLPPAAGAAGPPTTTTTTTGPPAAVTPAAAVTGSPPPPPPQPPLASSKAVAVPSPGPYAGNSAAPGSSPFSSSSFMYGSDTTASGEKPMSPAFAAALSFARGVPSLPAASSPERSPWALQPPQPQPQPPQTPPAQQPAAAGSTAAVQQVVEVQVVQAAPPGTAAAAAAGAGGGGGGGLHPLHDLDEAESISMLMIAFRSLKALSVDPRPEARNAAVRTLFLAVGSHGGKFPSATWQELFGSLLFDLLLTIHRVAANSSVEEAAAVELGKEKGGRPVVMLVHHSRNSEQKQWDETLVLALGGAAKVMRSYMHVLSGLDVWAKAWEDLMQVIGELLASGRKGLCLASTALLTTVLQAHGSGPLVSRTMWQQTLEALDKGVTAMTSPSTPVPLQARAELLTCITTLSSQLLLTRCSRPGAAGTNGDSTALIAAAAAGPGPDPEQLLLVFRWLDRFARYPVGADDTSSIHFTSIGPIQKAVLTAMAGLAPAAAAAGVWPAVLSLLCNMLRPFSTLALRQYAQQAAALQQQRKLATGAAQWSSFASAPDTAAAVAAAAGHPPAPTAASVPTLDSMASYTSVASSSRDTSVHNPGSAGVSPWLAFACSAEVMEARAMSPLWMARVVELLATWYRDQVSWQVRVATFPLLVGAMSECMACRHLLPGAAHSPGSGAGVGVVVVPPQLHLVGDSGEAQALEELWRAAARGFVTVVQTGLPSINICSSQGQQLQQQQQQQVVVPQSTWPALARAFQMFFLALSLPPLVQPPPELQHSLALAVAASGGSGATAAYFRRMSSSAEPSAAAPCQPSAEQVAADLEITTAVLDCLSETVLSSCQHAPVEMRRTLVEVLDAGAASAAAPSAAGISLLAATDRPYDESGLPPTSRLSHVCLNKLYVLCSRGQEAPAADSDGRGDSGQQPGNRSQLEVAQLALPVFVTRCEAILQEYARAEHRTRSASTSTSTSVTNPRAAGTQPEGHATAGALPPALTPVRTAACSSGPAGLSVALHDKARHVLELLQQLRVVPPVSDSLLLSRPHLRFWLEVLRAVRAQAALPPPALAAGAAAAAAAAAAASAGGHPALSSMPSFGGGISGPGSGVLASPPAISRRSSSGFELMSPTAAVAAAGGAGPFAPTAAGEPTSTANGAAPAARSSSSSFFSRTYSSTGALLATAMGAAASGTGGAVTGAPNAPKRPSVSGSGGGGGGAGPVLRNAGSMSGQHSHGPPSLASASSAGAGGLSLGGKSLWVKEQPHLLALYGVLCECIGSSDPSVRAAVQGMLATLGAGVGLCAAAPGAPQPPLL